VVRCPTQAAISKSGMSAWIASETKKCRKLFGVYFGVPASLAAALNWSRNQS